MSALAVRELLVGLAVEFRLTLGEVDFVALFGLGGGREYRRLALILSRSVKATR